MEYDDDESFQMQEIMNIVSDEKKKKKKKSSPKKDRHVELEESIDEPVDDTIVVSPKKKKKKRAKSESPPPAIEDSDEEPTPVQSQQSTQQEPGPSQKTGKSKPKKVAQPTKTKAQIAAEKAEEDKLARDGMNILVTMSHEDVEEFLSRMDTQCPPDDTRYIRLRENSIDWEKVSFSLYGPHQCKAIWTYIRNNARKFRIMHEVVDEMKLYIKADYSKFLRKMVESAPDFPQKTYSMGAFQMYCKEQWDKYKEMQGKLNAKVENFLAFQTKSHTKWNKLTPQIRQEYEVKAKEAVADYKRKVKEFYAKYPGVVLYEKNGKAEKGAKQPREKGDKPMSKNFRKQALKLSNEMYPDAPALPMCPNRLFINAKLNRLEAPPAADELAELKLHFFEKWKKLSNSKKLKWIEKCIKKCETYMEEVREYKKSHPLFLLPEEFKISKLISKEEFNIWAEAHGKPPKPKNSIFEVFLEDFSNSEEGTGIPEEEIQTVAKGKWEELDWYHKEMYGMRYKMQQMTFKRDIEKYFSGLPEMLKKVALGAIPKKFHQTLMEEVDTEPFVPVDEEPNDSNVKSPKKRKKGASDDEEAAGDGESQDDTDRSPSKKKKKKKHHQDNEEEKTVKSAKDLPLYMVQLTEEHKQLIERKIAEEKNFAKRNYKQKIKRKVNDDDPDNIIDGVVDKKVESVKPSSSECYPGKIITTSLLNEAIRGIFDGRQSLGRCFSVYYFYAKYVSRLTPWRQMCTTKGVIETAARMIEKFNRLSKHQKEIFISDAWKYHQNRYYGKKIFSEKDLFLPEYTHFPNEPKPPPVNAVKLYQNTMKLRKLDDPDVKAVPWSELDEKTQMFYVKQLYKSTKEYVKKYESFVRNMTPYDLVDYFVQRCHEMDKVENKMNYGNRMLSLAGKDFIHPFTGATYSTCLSDDGQESEPEYCESTMYRFDNKMEMHRVKYKNNPFYDGGCSKSGFPKKTLIEKLSSSGKKTNEMSLDSDDPSSSDSDNDALEPSTSKSQDYNAQKLERKIKRKIRRLETYNYPLEDLYEPPVFIHGNVVGLCSVRRYLELQKVFLDRTRRQSLGNILMNKSRSSSRQMKKDKSGEDAAVTNIDEVNARKIKAKLDEAAFKILTRTKHQKNRKRVKGPIVRFKSKKQTQKSKKTKLKEDCLENKASNSETEQVVQETNENESNPVGHATERCIEPEFLIPDRQPRLMLVAPSPLKKPDKPS